MTPCIYAKEMINVAFNIDNKYTTYALLTINSILKNNKSNSDYTFYVLHDGLSWWNKWRMKRFVHKHKQKIEFVYVDIPRRMGRGEHNEIYKKTLPYISNIAMARIFIPDVLPKSVKKCIYLDCDTLVLTDLKELWNICVTNYAVALSIDIYAHKTKDFLYPECLPYYNSGVILINVDYWRKNNTVEQLVQYLRCHNLIFPDQDAINVILKGKILTLDTKYNNLCMISYNYPIYNKSSDCILHFASQIKPWSCFKMPYNMRYKNVCNFIDSL